MTWILLSILAGLADATVYAAMKKLSDVPPHVTLWWRSALALPVLATLLAVDGMPELKPGLLPVLLFREGRIRQSLAGAAIMFAGVVLITLAGS